MRVLALSGDSRALVAEERPVPRPRAGQVRIAVAACGVCRTDLHLVDGELPDPAPRVVPGHEIVGRIDALGPGVDSLAIGDRVGVPWLAWTCGECGSCRRDRENLCEQARFTGYTVDGGYAEFALADARYCFRIPDAYDDVAAAPLLCAGLIGYRALRMAGDARRVGLYGLGAAAHILAQLCVGQGREVFAFVRPGDTAGLAFAKRLGATWCGGSDELPPERLDAALIFAPVGDLVPAALRALASGGTAVCAGIHMSDIPSFPYELLWRERCVRSVANLTRRDGVEFFREIARHPVAPVVTTYALSRANEALEDLRRGRVEGAAVLVPASRSS